MDKPILKRSVHGFNLSCLPANFDGPLKTARVVLLYLSPGLSESDIEEANKSDAQQRYAMRRAGYSPLTSKEQHLSGWEWWTSRTKSFGDPDKISNNLAILNISPYHSSSFRDYPMLAALPSCRASLDWAHRVLFPQAEQGERVVVCLRAARYWGLGHNERYGRGLFAPKVSRSGHMHKGASPSGADEQPLNRADVIEAVKKALDTPPLST